MTLAPYVAIARPSHWVKNVFVLPGAAVALMLGVPVSSRLAWTLPLGLLATCLAASANYVINEWLDARSDQFHPLKKDRPSVLGSVTGSGVVVEYLVLALAAVALAVPIGIPFALTTVLLLIASLIYNVRPIRSKDRKYFDVLSESVNNPIRFMLGWFAVTAVFLPPSSVLLGYWMGGAFLMAVKRLAEYRFIGDKQTAALYRRSFESYSETSLLVFSLFCAQMSVFFLGVFLVKHRVELVIAIPFLAFLFCRYLRISMGPESVAQRPERLYRERSLIVYIALLVALVVALAFVKIPQLEWLSNSSLVRL